MYLVSVKSSDLELDELVVARVGVGRVDIGMSWSEVGSKNIVRLACG